MVDITLDLSKTLEQNSQVYYAKVKKAKKRVEGAGEIVEKTKKDLEKLRSERDQALEKFQDEQAKKEKRRYFWFEKFRWFVSTGGFLCIGGRDATSNEIVVKKHTAKDDLVFHTEAPGSPFFVIQNPTGKDIDEQSCFEVAQTAASYSKAWQQGFSSVEAFSVTPEQVSKEANSGEYMSKGSFMIRGKKTLYHPDIGLAIGCITLSREQIALFSADHGHDASGADKNLVYDDEQERDGDGSVRLLMGASPSTIRRLCDEFVVIKPGRRKSSDLAKEIAKKLSYDDLDDIIRVIPAGGSEIVKQ